MRTRLKNFYSTYKKKLIFGSVIGLVIIFLLTSNAIICRNIISAKNNVNDNQNMHGINSLIRVGADGLSEEIVYENIIIKVDAPAGAFPEGTELRIVPITLETQQQEIKEKLKKQSDKITEDSETISFDISFIGWDENGNEIELDPAEGKTVKISINYKNNDKFSNIDESNDRELKIYHLEEKTDEEGNKTDGVEIEEVVINHEESCKGELVADVNKFSVYSVADVESPSLRAAICTVTFQNGECYFGTQEKDGTCGFDMPAPIEVECGGTVSRQDIDEPYYTNTTSKYDETYNYNYYFTRWTTTLDPGYTSTNYNYNFNTPVTEDIILYAIGAYKSSQNGSNNANYTKTVTFNANGGTLTSTGSMLYGMYGLIKQPSDPIRAGYMLNCWSTRQTDTSCSYAYDFNSTTNTVIDDVDLYAQWSSLSYTIRFNANAGNGSINDINASYNNDYQLPSSGFSRNGYDLVGWNTESDGSGTGYDLGEVVRNITTTNGDIVTLYAQWGQMNRVTFEGNGGTVSVSYIDVVSGQVAEAPEEPTWSKHGFLGWYLTGSNSVFNFSTPITSDITLYAHWEELETVTVTFNSNGGSSVEPQEINPGERAVKPTNPTKNNQGFKYWTTDSAGNNEYDFKTPVTDDLILYAQWANICTVTFQNGYCYYNNNTNAQCTFSFTTTSVSVACGTPVERPEDPDSPITVTMGSRYNQQDRNMYFSKWSKTQNPGYNNTSNNYDFSTPVTSNLTLYAIGYVSYFTVTFNANGGMLNGPSRVTVGQYTRNNTVYGGYARRPEDPIRTGYDFKWWSTSNSTNGSEFNFNTTRITADTPLYALWTPITYVIRYNANGGTGTMSNTDMTYDTPDNLRTNTFTKANATFSGWNTKANGSGTGYSNGASVNNLTDVAGRRIDLYAQWNCNEGYHDDNGACVSDICEFLGQTIPNGSGLTVYSTSSVTCPNSCTAGTVTCNNGILGGDTEYASLSCSPVSSGCDSSYNLLSTGANGTYSSCTSYTANGNSCTPGTTLYRLESCNSGYTQVGDSCKEDCTFNGQTIPHGSSVLAFSESYQMCPNQCASETRTCNDGILSGSYTNNNCTVGPFECSEDFYPFTVCPANGICTQSCTPYTVNNNSCTIGTVRYQLNGCESGYHSEDGESCTGDTKQVQCIQGYKPSNSSYVQSSVRISWQGLRDDGSWSTAADCAWTCNEHYHTGANNESCEIDRFNITWKNSDGSTLEIDTGVAYGSTPTYNGATPTSGGDAQYSYEFSGWTPEISPVAGNTTYTAVYTKIINNYTVLINSSNTNSGTVSTGLITVPYGTTISITGNPITIFNKTITATPNPQTAQYTHQFVNWTTTCGNTVTTGCTITANFSSTLRTYTVTWKNSNGSTLETDENVPYGTTPSYDGATPTSGGDAQYSYTFSRWTPTISSVTGNITYTAVYTQTVNKYTVTWKNSDGSTLETDENIPYGTTPSYDGATPTSGGDAQYSYTFSRWTPTISSVTGNITYTAVYTQTVNTYTVTWKNEDESILETDTGVEYGSIPEYNGSTPQKAGTLIYSYAFSGWTPEISQVHGNQTYTATYTRTMRKYKVTWKNIDGTVLETDTGVAYGSMPEYNSAIPTNGATNQYVTSTFSGWNPTLSTVESDAEYMARYIYTLNSGYILDTTKGQVHLTLNGNGGEFTNNSSLDVIDYDYYNRGELRYSHSLNYTDDGIRNSAATSSDSGQYLTTITGAEYLYVNVTYDLHEILLGLINRSKDKLDIYAGTTTSATAVAHFSGNTNDGIQGNENYVISGDSVLFSFSLANRNISSMESNGFYAAIVGVIPVGYITQEEIETPSREGYTFQGWYTQVEGGEQVDIDSLTMTEDTEIFAHWTINTYTITWKNDDNSVIDTTTGNYLTMPTHSDPIKTGNAQYSYIFTGWSPALSEITGDITYTAVYDTVINQYTATIVVSPEGYGSVNTGQVTKDYNSNISINGNTITIGGTQVVATATGNTDEYTYTFSGWINECGNILTGDCTITAEFSRQKNEYLITFQNRNGNILKSGLVEYGKTPSAPVDPSRPATQGFTYIFTGWTPTISPVTGSIVYTAVYDSIINQYTATIIVSPEGYGSVNTGQVTKNYNSSISISGGSGEILTIGGTQVIATATGRTDEYRYVFSGWINECGNTLTGDCIITAKFDRIKNKYLILFRDRDETILQGDMIEYGELPHYDGEIPEREGNENYEYNFIGWTPEILEVTGDIDYIAEYEALPIPHIRFLSPTPADGAEITGNRFTTKVEISNIENINSITYNVNGESYTLQGLNFGYNFDNAGTLGELENESVKSIASENDGVVHGATRVSSGRYGGAYYFDGIDDYIELDRGNGGRSAIVEFRAKPEGGEWTHVSIGARDEYSINGKPVDELPSEFANIAQPTSSAYIGTNGAGGYFEGLIDEVKYYRMGSSLTKYISNLKKTNVDKFEFEIIKPCLDASGAYEYSISVSSPKNVISSTGRSLTTNIPGISVEGTGYDFGIHETNETGFILSGTMGTLTVTDRLGSGGWLVYLATSESMIGTATNETITTNNLKFKANELVYNGIYEGYTNTYVSFGDGISTTEFTTAQSQCIDEAHCSSEGYAILEYMKRESDPDDFMCGEVGTYSDNMKVELEVPAWQVEDIYEGVLWITLQEERNR